MSTTYKYTAFNDNSYCNLANFAASLPVNVTLFPEQMTVVIDATAAKTVGEFIANTSLEVLAESVTAIEDNIADAAAEIAADPTADADTLRAVVNALLEEKTLAAESHNNIITDMAQERDTAQKDRDMYHRWYTEAAQHASRVKNQIQAIAVLINEVYPRG